MIRRDRPMWQPLRAFRLFQLSFNIFINCNDVGCGNIMRSKNSQNVFPIAGSKVADNICRRNTK